MTAPQPPESAGPVEDSVSEGTDDGVSEGQDDGVIEAIHTALAKLDTIRDEPVQEHVQCFEAVHTALTDALSTADTYVSGTSGNRS